MFSMNASNGIVRIFDRNNEITFYPSTYLIGNEKHFCYNIELNCREYFFRELFSHIFDYKQIKLDAKNKKYNFNFLDNHNYYNVLIELEYLEVDMRDIFIKSYRDFDFTKDDECNFEFAKV